mmetsp:Transcript_70914/g.178784  ORF Transcript_70914/g.178784 Transcript_70914/m.178784 type:complete len:221 (-) Transcript_70914:234-896(-)
MVDRAILWRGTLELLHCAHEDPPPLAQRRGRRAHQLGFGPYQPTLFLPLRAPLHPLLDRLEPPRAPRQASGVVVGRETGLWHGGVLRRRLGAALLGPGFLLRVLALPSHGRCRPPECHLLFVARLCGGVRPRESVRQFRYDFGRTRQHLERGLPCRPPPPPECALDGCSRTLRAAPRSVREGQSHHLPKHGGGAIAAVVIRAELGHDGEALCGSGRRAHT